MPNITIDHANLMAFSRVSGFLDADQILKIMADADDAIQAFGKRMSQHGRLYDLSDAQVAPPSAINALCDMTIDPARISLRANRVAYFGASPLLKSQMRRVCSLRSGSAVFDERRAAHAWAIGGR